MGSKGAKSKSTRRNNALKRKILDPSKSSDNDAIVFTKKIEKLNHINQMQQRGYDLLSKPKSSSLTPRGGTKERLQVSKRPRCDFPSENSPADH